MFIKTSSLVLLFTLLTASVPASELPEKMIERRIEFLKAYIENQDKILKLSDKIPPDYLEAQKAFLSYSPVTGDAASDVKRDLATASLFYAASQSAFAMAREFYTEVIKCRTVNEKYLKFLPLEKFKGDPEKTCIFTDDEKKKYPQVDISLFCLNSNYKCAPVIHNLSVLIKHSSDGSRIFQNRENDEGFNYKLLHFSSEWSEKSLEEFRSQCHPPLYPKCEKHCDLFKWPVQVTVDHFQGCQKIKEVDEATNILTKTRIRSLVQQPHAPLYFDSQRTINGDFSVDRRLLAIQVKNRNYFLYSALLRGSAWYAMGETLFLKHKNDPATKEFWKSRMNAQDKKIATQEVLDRARFHFSIDDYMKNF